MTWAIAKSCGLSLPSPVTFKQELLPEKPKPFYLGFTIGSMGLLDERLLVRLRSAGKLLMQLRSTTRKWNLSV